jgi:diacylglycerol kinase family enzyme
VANGQFFGSGYGIAPDARIDDGMFQIVLAGDVSMWDYFKNFGNLRKSRPIVLDDLTYHVTDHVTVEPLGENVYIEADGEIHGIAPLYFQCVPKALPFLMPN